MYCGRRLFVHPSFHYLVHLDENSFEKVSSLLLLFSTPIHCQYTVETFLDDARLLIFERIEPKVYREKFALLQLVLQCQQRIRSIDSFLQQNSINDEFGNAQVTLTSVALERKYLFGEIIDRCTDSLDAIEVSIDCYFPYAQHAALLFSVLQRMNLLGKGNYQFSIEIIFRLIDQIFPKDKTQTDKAEPKNDLWKDVDENRNPSICFFSVRLSLRLFFVQSTLNCPV